MIAYIDTSALLRIVLREPGALEDLRSYDGACFQRTHCCRKRADDRSTANQGSLTTEEAVERIRAVNEWLEAIDLVLLRPPVLSRASEPMPMPIGTLDAIHLATALIWRDRRDRCRRWRRMI